MNKNTNEQCANPSSKPNSKPSSKKSSVKKEELLKGKTQLHHVAKSQIHDKSAANVKQAAEQAKAKKNQQC